MGREAIDEMVEMGEEEWRVIGSHSTHEVSSFGRIKRTQTGSILKGYLLLGYPAVHFGKVHRMVLEAFVGPCPEGMETRHLDGNRQNNHVSNLQWAPHIVNMADLRKHGTRKGFVPWNKGKPWDDETKAKISKAAIGNTHSKGVVRSEESKAKMRVSALARVEQLKQKGLLANGQPAATWKHPGWVNRKKK